LAAHVSQYTPLSAAPGDEAILSPSTMAHFQRNYEVFIVADRAASTRREYFDNLYAQHPDPWGLTHRFYERRKRDLLLASLPRPHFRRAFEPGCAVGLLTAELAQRCDEVVAWDGAQVAVDQTTAHLARHASAGAVSVARARIPGQWPTGRFDLIVLSEVGYYCADQHQLRSHVEASLAADGVLVACHWRHPAADHAVTAEAVHASVGQDLYRIVTHHESDFMLDVWTRDGNSVAQLDGIIT
jgi:SAM-dependent methyltransferase